MIRILALVGIFLFIDHTSFAQFAQFQNVPGLLPSGPDNLLALPLRWHVQFVHVHTSNEGFPSEHNIFGAQILFLGIQALEELQHGGGLSLETGQLVGGVFVVLGRRRGGSQLL